MKVMYEQRMMCRLRFMVISGFLFFKSFAKGSIEHITLPAPRQFELTTKNSRQAL
jgi:hypothetical protein